MLLLPPLRLWNWASRLDSNLNNFREEVWSAQSESPAHHCGQGDGEPGGQLHRNHMGGWMWGGGSWKKESLPPGEGRVMKSRRSCPLQGVKLVQRKEGTVLESSPSVPLIWMAAYIHTSHSSEFFFFSLNHVVCVILASWPWLKPVPPALGAWSLNHGMASKVPFLK